MPDFAPDTRVRVRADTPPGHVRTPYYLRGKAGVVELRLGPSPNPEDLAYRLPGVALPLYRVRFAMGDLWGADAERPDDTLEADLAGQP